MRRVTAIRPAGHWPPASAIDRVVLDADERPRRRIVLTGERGTQVLLDLEKPVALREGDGLALDDGAIVQVAGRRAPLVEVSTARKHDIVRLAWHLGNRHAEVQVMGEKLRIRRDHVLEDMLKALGADLTPIDAPFEPEGGAYGHHEHEHGA